MKFVRGFIGWICTIVVIWLLGGAWAVSIAHVERDENGKITNMKYD